VFLTKEAGVNALDEGHDANRLSSAANAVIEDVWSCMISSRVVIICQGN